MTAGPKPGYGRLILTFVVVSAMLSSCLDGPSTTARQQQLKTVEDKMVSAKLGRLLHHSVGGTNGLSGDGPFRRSFYEPGSVTRAVIAEVAKARLASVGLRALGNDHPCDDRGPCAFEDPNTANVLVSVLVADRQAMMKSYQVDLRSIKHEVIVVEIF